MVAESRADGAFRASEWRESKVGSTLCARIVLSGLTTVDMATVPFMLRKHYAHTALIGKTAKSN